jgi:hypothetical protein
VVDNDLFVDAVVTATRTVEHTHQEDKISALRNAVLNSVAPGAPDADTQAIFLNFVDRFTPLASAADDALGRSADMVLIARTDPARGRIYRQQNGDRGSRFAGDAGAERFLPAHRQ